MKRFHAFTISYNTIVEQIKHDITLFDKSREIIVPGMWDTGATNTCISHNVVDQFGLIPKEQINVMNSGGICKQNTYVISIRLSDINIIDLPVIESEIHLQGIDVLIGMDVINRGDMSISNFDGKTTFSFRCPSCGTIDYCIK